MGEQDTAFRALLRQRHMSYGAFCREWDRVAKSTDEAVLIGHYPGRAQFYRWVRGELINKRPYPDACRMLEAMFPGWPVERLFSPYTGEEPPDLFLFSRPDSGQVRGQAVSVSRSPDKEVSQSSPDETVIPVQENRDFPAITGESDQIELLRRQMNDVLSRGSMSDASLDEWEHTAIRYARATRDRSPLVLVADIGRDLAELNRLLSRQRSASALRRLTRVTAQMSGLMCLTFCLLDDRPAFRRWARTARLAASEADDPETLSWVLAQEAYGHYYSGDILEAIDVSRHACEVVDSHCTGAALAAALEARAQAAMGRQQETRDALARCENVLSHLDGDALIPSAFGYNEASFRFHEGNAYTHLRDVKSALKAQERAIGL